MSRQPKSPEVTGTTLASHVARWRRDQMTSGQLANKFREAIGTLIDDSDDDSALLQALAERLDQHMARRGQ